MSLPPAEKYYSPSTKGFYTTELHGAKIPEDAIGLTNAEWRALLDSERAAAGSAIMLVHNGVGLPTLGPRPIKPAPPTEQ